MADQLLATAMIAAAVTSAGAWLALSSLRRGQTRLSDAFAVLDDFQTSRRPTGPAILADQGSRLEMAAVWLYQHARLPLPAASARVLLLQGRSIGDYFVHKLVLAVAGMALPGLLAVALAPKVAQLGALPIGVGLVAGAIGWLWPDISMRKHQQQTSADAQEALNTFFDLVVLERLANLSATQSLEAAASLSDVPVFVSIRRALEQARLEQRAPWPDLHRLSVDLGLSQIADIADVMQLDDQGAALAEVLMSRVQELRDAHLTRERNAAHQLSERMTLWMSVPVIMFALAFLIPPVLNIAGIT